MNLQILDIDIFPQSVGEMKLPQAAKPKNLVNL